MIRHSYGFAIRTAAFLFLIICVSSPAIFGQRLVRPTLPDVIPSPKSVLGFAPGNDRTIADWNQITDYFARLDKASDRVLVQTIGVSTLKRPIIVVAISARENLVALDKYKEIQRRLADPRLITNALERDRLIQNGKVVVTISCSIHSTEIVASQMSMELAYQLATAQDPDTRTILQNTILLLIPSPNPDGVDIVANWYRRTLGTTFEGSEPPELYHHYAGHDDNRDWFMLNLKETKAITRMLWKEWFPQIVYDIHQQGSNGSRFFVPPFYDPPNPRIAPLLLRHVGLLGHKIAADVTAAGFRGVLTNALYDTWWHGGFRTAPYYHNSIGILTEAASARIMTPSTVTQEQLARGGTRGLRTALDVTTNFPDPWPGGAWHPRDIMKMELIAAKAVLSLAGNYRADYLRNFYELGRKNTLLEGDDAYVIPPGQGRDENVAKTIGTLVEQGVEVYRLDTELHGITAEQVLKKVDNAQAGSPTRKVMTQPRPMEEIPAGSYIIFLNQPYRQNVLALFEPQIYPDRLTPTGEAERPYDVAGWTLPLQMGVESLVVISIREAVNERKLTLVRNENEVRRDLGLTLWTTDKSPINNPVRPGTRIGIYQSARGNMDEGWTRYVFDTFNVPYQTVRDAGMRAGDLRSRFDVIVLPSEREREIVEGNVAGSLPAEFTGGIGEIGATNLVRFVAAGGTLICFDASCELAVKRFQLPLKNVLAGLRSSDFYCPGSILRLSVDTTSPIAKRMRAEADAYFINSSAFELIENTTAGRAPAPPGLRVIARYAKENVLRSGWLLGEDKLKDRIALAEAEYGKGRVVLFAFRPQHRGQTWSTFRFIWNSIAAHAD